MATKGETAMARTEYVIEPGKQEILSTTVFDAPRELVFKAYTDPNLLAQWWGPRRYETKIDTFEARAGGSWRMRTIGANGEEQALRGVNHSVVGEWTSASEKYSEGRGHTTVAPTEDGKFMRITSREEDARFPESTQLVGADESRDICTVLYYDARGVHRVYSMSFVDRVWK